MSLICECCAPYLTEQEGRQAPRCPRAPAYLCLQHLATQGFIIPGVPQPVRFLGTPHRSWAALRTVRQN